VLEGHSINHAKLAVFNIVFAQVIRELGGLAELKYAAD
jgi:hypothetical protein